MVGNLGNGSLGNENKNFNKEGFVEKSPETLKDDEATHKTSYWEGLVHMFRGTVGTGILALPAAFNQAGYIGGILGIVGVTFMVNYCSLLLARSQLELARRRNVASMTYQGTVQAAFEYGPKGIKKCAPIFAKLTNALLIFGQIAGNCTYVIFIATNLKEVFDPHVGIRSLREYIAWSTPFILAANLVITLKKMAIVSLFGNIVLLSSVSVIFYYVTQDLPSLEERKMFGDVRDIPYFMGTIFFATGCLSLVLPLQNDMKNPLKMSSTFGLLNVNSTFTGILYLVFGLLGYLKYGPAATQATVTVNLPKYSLSATLVQVFLSISTITVIAVQNYVLLDVVWNDYLCYIVKKNVTFMQYLLKIAIVSIIVLGALVVPNLKLLISLIGIIGQCTLCSTFPCIIHIFTYREQPSLWAFIKKFYLDAIVLAFNIFILTFELSKIITEIVEVFS